jgi:regulator of replication initiation timing
MWRNVIQTAIFVLGAGLIGFLAGWFLSRIVHSLKSVELMGELRDKMCGDEEALAAARGDLAAQTARAVALQSQLEQLTAAQDERTAGLGASEERVRELEAEVAARVSELDTREVALEAALAEQGRLRAESQALAARLAEVEAAAEKAAAQSEMRFEALRDGFGAQEQELAKAQFRLKQLEVQIRERDARLEDLEAARRAEAQGRPDDIAALNGQLGAAEAALRQAALDREAELSALRARVTELELLLRQPPKERGDLSSPRWGLQKVGAGRVISPGGGPPGSGSPRDDLKKIRGIGPALERQLNSCGIYSFRQIAAWTEREIEEFGTQLDGFQGRIRRDDWVRGAKEAHLKKYGEQL